MRIPLHQKWPDGTAVKFSAEARSAMHPVSVLDHPLTRPSLGETAVYTITNTQDLFHDVVLQETGQRYGVHWFEEAAAD